MCGVSADFCREIAIFPVGPDFEVAMDALRKGDFGRFLQEVLEQLPLYVWEHDSEAFERR